MRLSFTGFILLLLLLLGATVGGWAVAQGKAVSPKTGKQAIPDTPELSAHLTQLEQQFVEGQAPHDPQNRTLLRLKLEQAELWLQVVHDKEHPPPVQVVVPDAGIHPIVQKDLPWILTITLDEAKRNLQSTLHRADLIILATGDAAYAAHVNSPGAQERAYISVADGSVQPYRVILPDNFQLNRQYPLVVFLHGYSVETTKINPKIPAKNTWQQSIGGDFLIAEPYGRRNTDFVSIGEDDVLTVLNEVERLYHVDKSRVFLLGASMGGYGTYTVGLHHPDLWAGLVPVCGQADWYFWLQLKRDSLPPWKSLLYDAVDPRHLEKNALQVPVFIQHGTLDQTVSVFHSRTMSADLRALHYFVQYDEESWGDHGFTQNPAIYAQALEWMRNLKTRTHPLQPRHVRYVTGNLHEHQAYWVDIRALDDYSQTASIDAQVDYSNIVRVHTKNVSRFVLNPPPGLFPKRKTAVPIMLWVNGVKTNKRYMPGETISWSEEALKVPEVGESFPGNKSPERCGPIANCYRNAFLLVYGTLKTDATDQKNAQRFRDEWQRFADGVPPVKADNEVTAHDRQQYNLILFGNRDSNSVIKEIADNLPVELTPQGYRLGTRSVSYSQGHLGLQLCYPSPFNTQRMVVIQSGLYWGDSLPINHKFDLLPDYIIYGKAIDHSDQTNVAVAAGFFDGRWQLK